MLTAIFSSRLIFSKKYLHPAFRDRAFKAKKDPFSGASILIVDNKPLRLVNVDELLSAVAGYGQKESGRDPGFMWVTMNVIQDPRIALAAMVYDGVFDASTVCA